MIIIFYAPNACNGTKVLGRHSTIVYIVNIIFRFIFALIFRLIPDSGLWNVIVRSVLHRSDDCDTIGAEDSNEETKD